MFIVIWVVRKGKEVLREVLKFLDFGFGVGRSYGRELMNRKVSVVERFRVG